MEKRRKLLNQKSEILGQDQIAKLGFPISGKMILAEFMVFGGILGHKMGVS